LSKRFVFCFQPEQDRFTHHSDCIKQIKMDLLQTTTNMDNDWTVPYLQTVLPIGILFLLVLFLLIFLAVRTGTGRLYWEQRKTNDLLKGWLSEKRNS
jgi:hypothetical protein